MKNNFINDPWRINSILNVGGGGGGGGVRDKKKSY